MGIVLNEHEYAEEAIEKKELGKKPSETLCRVARYIKDTNPQYTKNEIRKELDLFLLKCNPSASLPKWSKMLDFATKQAFKREAIQIDSLAITKPEMEKIDALDGRQTKRLAFTLLCLSKYWDEANPQNDHWVNNKDNEIMNFANINTSIRRQCSMYAELKENSLIQFSKKVDNTNIKVLFAENGETVLEIKDLRNIGYQYLKYHNEPYFECTNCGLTVKINNPGRGRKQKYCKDCAVEVKMKQNVNSIMRNQGHEKFTCNDD